MKSREIIFLVEEICNNERGYLTIRKSFVLENQQ